MGEKPGPAPPRRHPPLERAPAFSSVFRILWDVVSRVPRGRVATYGQVARMAGLPGAARTVGWALRALPDGARVAGREVPWHRVINAQGRISLRSGDPGGEGGRQARRLRAEGVPVSRAGQIDLARFAWKGGRRPVRSGGQAGTSASGNAGRAAPRGGAAGRVPNCSSQRRA